MRFDQWFSGSTNKPVNQCSTGLMTGPVFKTLLPTTTPPHHHCQNRPTPCRTGGAATHRPKTPDLWTKPQNPNQENRSVTRQIHHEPKQQQGRQNHPSSTQETTKTPHYKLSNNNHLIDSSKPPQPEQIYHRNHSRSNNIPPSPEATTTWNMSTDKKRTPRYKLSNNNHQIDSSKPPP
jgi:hypothetical protein